MNILSRGAFILSTSVILGACSREGEQPPPPRQTVTENYRGFSRLREAIHREEFDLSDSANYREQAATLPPYKQKKIGELLQRYVEMGTKIENSYTSSVDVQNWAQFEQELQNGKQALHALSQTLVRGERPSFPNGFQMRVDETPQQACDRYGREYQYQSRCVVVEMADGQPGCNCNTRLQSKKRKSPGYVIPSF